MNKFKEIVAPLSSGIKISANGDQLYFNISRPLSNQTFWVLAFLVRVRLNKDGVED